LPAFSILSDACILLMPSYSIISGQPAVLSEADTLRALSLAKLALATTPKTVVSGMQCLGHGAMPEDLAGDTSQAAVKAVLSSTVAADMFLDLLDSPKVAARQPRALAAARATSLHGERLLSWLTDTAEASHQLCALQGEHWHHTLFALAYRPASKPLEALHHTCGQHCLRAAMSGLCALDSRESR
jgi:hypothetical protein